MQVLRTCLLPPASQVPPSWGAGGLSPQWEIKAGRGWTYRDRDHGCPCGPSSQGGRASLRGGRCLSQGHELQLAREGFSGQGIACSTRNGHRRRGVTGGGLSLELHPCVQWKALMCTPKKQPEKSEQPREAFSPPLHFPRGCRHPGTAPSPRVESTHEQQLMQTHRSDRFPPPAAGPTVTGAAGGARRGLQERGEEGGRGRRWREAEAGRQDAGLSLSELCGGPPDALITPGCKSTLQPRMCL